MRTIVLVLAAALATEFGSAQAAQTSQRHDASREGPSQEGSNMPSVWLGENSKLTVNPSERDRVRKFYKDVLGCPATRESEKIDIFHIGSGFFLAVVYDSSALSASDNLKAIWLDLRTNQPELLKRKILEFGLKQIDFWDKEHFYFQAPGGQVFRLVGSNEDMSKWQR
jgi:hypothetical protein